MQLNDVTRAGMAAPRNPRLCRKTAGEANTEEHGQGGSTVGGGVFAATEDKVAVISVGVRGDLRGRLAKASFKGPRLVLRLMECRRLRKSGYTLSFIIVVSVTLVMDVAVVC